MLRRLFALFLLLGVLGVGLYAAWRVVRVDPPLARAAKLNASGDLFGAQVVLRGMIKEHPRGIEAHLMLAGTQFATGDWLAAEKEARTLRALGYDRMVAIPMLARSLMMQNRFRDMLSEIPAVPSRPDEQSMNLALRSAGYLGLNDLVQAQASIDAAAGLSPGSFLVQLQQARLALAKHDVAAGLYAVDQALAGQRRDPDALVIKSELLGLQWDTVGAVRALDMAIEVSPMLPGVRMARAGLLLTLGLDRQAQADVDAVFEMTSSNPTALFYNAVLMFRAGQNADAAIEFDKLGLLLEQFPKAYFYKAQISLASGHTQSALDDLGRLLRLQPGDGDGVRLAAQIELREARPERALSVLSGATQEESRDAGSIDLQGRAYFMMGRMAEAIESFRRAAAMAPDNREFSSHLAAAQTQFGAAPVPDEASGPWQR